MWLQLSNFFSTYIFISVIFFSHYFLLLHCILRPDDVTKFRSDDGKLRGMYLCCTIYNIHGNYYHSYIHLLSQFFFGLSIFNLWNFLLMDKNFLTHSIISCLSSVYPHEIEVNCWVSLNFIKSGVYIVIKIHICFYSDMLVQNMHMY